MRQESNSDPKFIIHGLLMFAWFILFVVQANFIRKGNYKAHIKWGIVGLVAAIGVFLSTLYVFVAVYKGWDAMPYFAKANRFFLLSFAVLVVLGYRNRQNGTKHKQLIYMASLLILEPILSRVTGNLHIEDYEAYIAVIIVWNGLFISLLVYDWLTLKKYIKSVGWDLLGFISYKQFHY